MHRPKFRRNAKRGLVAGAGLGLSAQSASAHTTQVAGDVAGLWHIEPDHSPRAGEPAQVWIALTQRGGSPIPLEQCRCELEIVNLGDPDAAPLQPELSALSPETYQQVPGAAVEFPDPGEYGITLTGSPQAGATFQPFELNTTVLVSAGRASAQPEAQEVVPSSQAQLPGAEPVESLPTPIPWIPAVAIAIGLAIAGTVYGLRRAKS